MRLQKRQWRDEADIDHPWLAPEIGRRLCRGQPGEFHCRPKGKFGPRQGTRVEAVCEIVALHGTVFVTGWY